MAAVIMPASALVHSPTPYRSDVLSIVDLQRNRLIVFGGSDSSGSQNDTWALSLASLHWTRLNPAGTPPSGVTKGYPGKSSFYSKSSDEMLVLAASLDSVWALSLGNSPAWRLMKPSTVPPMRVGEALAFDPIRRRIVMYAGDTCIPHCELDDVWAFELASGNWTLLHANGAPGSGGSQTGCLGTYDALTDHVVVLGGQANGGLQIRSNNDVRTYSEPSDTWALLKSRGYFTNFVFPAGFFMDPGRGRLLALQTDANIWRSTTADSVSWTVIAAGTYHPLALGAWNVAYDSLMARVLLTAPDGVWQTPIEASQGWVPLTASTSVGPGGDEEFALAGAIENPSNASLEVAFRLPNDRQATLALHDVSGRVLRRTTVFGVGAHTIAMGRGLDLRPGVYFLSLAQPGRQVSRRAIVLR